MRPAAGYNFSMSAPICITVNGAPRELPAPLTFSQLLDELALAGRRLAVERNGEIVPRSRFGDACVADGDRIEVVMAVGGGE
jgi:sulfur carrier protein